MISCEFRGELGNNLFQLAALIGHAEKNNLPFCLPPERDRNKPLEISSIFSFEYHYRDWVWPNIYKSSDLHKTGEDQIFLYQPIPIQDNTVLSGYFQSEKYFENVKDKLRNEYLKIKVEHTEYVKERYGDILSQNTVSLHSRNYGKGGYGPNIEWFHPFTPMSFYKEIVNILPNDYLYVIISQDIPWCKQNFSWIKNKVFIENGSIETDLTVMSMCKNNILANSTFSWWGAWLNPNPDKQVYVPYEKWWGPGYKHLDKSDMFPKEWILL